MTKSMMIDYPSIADILFNQTNIIHHNQGIDTTRQVAYYGTLKSMIEKIDLKATNVKRGSPVSGTVKRILKQVEEDDKIRYKADEFKPMVEVVKLAKGREVSNYMIIIRNTPELFDIASYHKKAKDTFCMIIFTGLHQPSKKINSQAIKVMSKFLKKRTFKLCSIDIVIDTNDSELINYGRKEPFREGLMPYSKDGVILPPKGATSLYINKIEHSSIDRILYYDKYQKQAKHHKQGVDDDLKEWKRLEVTLSFDVLESHNKGFINYIEGLNFIDDLYEIDDVATKAGIKSYENDYLVYQLNSLLDNRFMNNRESKEQFNSVEALERFSNSDFRRYTLPI